MSLAFSHSLQAPREQRSALLFVIVLALHGAALAWLWHKISTPTLPTHEATPTPLVWIDTSEPAAAPRPPSPPQPVVPRQQARDNTPKKHHPIPAVVPQSQPQQPAQRTTPSSVATNTSSDNNPAVQENKEPPHTATGTQSNPEPIQRKPENLPIVEARFDAAYLNNPKPRYPALSKRMKEVGKVLLRVRVSESGAPLNVELHTSSGSSRLDEAAIEAVKQWKFIPAHQGEQKITSTVIVPINFQLNTNE